MLRIKRVRKFEQKEIIASEQKETFLERILGKEDSLDLILTYRSPDEERETASDLRN